MPVTLEIDIENRLVISRFSGEFNIEAMLELRQQAIRIPAFSGDLVAIDDVTAVTTVSVLAEDLMHLSSQSLMNPGVRRAIVVSNDLQFGMARAYQMHSEFAGQDIQIFRDFEQARQWVTAD